MKHLEKNTQAPMWPVTAELRLTDQALVVDTAGTWYQAAGNKITPAASFAASAHNTKGALTLDAATNKGVLVGPGTWRVRGFIILTNTHASTAAIVKAALTDEVSSGSTTLHYEAHPVTLLGTASGEVVNQARIPIDILLTFSVAKYVVVRAALGTAATTGNCKAKSTIMFEKVANVNE